jgi:hypothetical protein
VSAGSIVVEVPWSTLGGPLRWRVGVGDLWGTPGQQLAAPPGPAVVTLAVETVMPGLWLQATTRFQVTVAPEGTTRIAVRGGLGHAF